MDKNECCLIGRINSPIKESKTQTGNPYIWFLLELEAKANATSTENNYHQKLNVMCFKKNVITYIKNVNAHIGNQVIVFGFISSFVTTIKGQQLISNAINGNEIYVIKTRLYQDEISK